MGAGFQSWLSLHWQIHPKIPTKEKMQNPDTCILFHGHGKTESNPRHLWLFQADFGFELGIIRINSLKNKSTLFRHTCREWQWQIFKTERTCSRSRLSDNCLRVTHQTDKGTGCKTDSWRLQGTPFQWENGSRWKNCQPRCFYERSGTHHRGHVCIWYGSR